MDWNDQDWQARADAGRGLGGQHLREGRPMPPFEWRDPHQYADPDAPVFAPMRAAGHTCEAWTGTFGPDGATACGRPASARLEASWGSSWYVCPIHDVRAP